MREVRPPGVGADARHAGHHLHLADQRALQPGLRQLGGSGLGVHRAMVALGGPEDPDPHDPRRAARAGRILSLLDPNPMSDASFELLTRTHGSSRSAGGDESSPLFLVGPARSGTSLL